MKRCTYRHVGQVRFADSNAREGNRVILFLEEAVSRILCQATSSTMEHQFQSIMGEPGIAGFNLDNLSVHSVRSGYYHRSAIFAKGKYTSGAYVHVSFDYLGGYRGTGVLRHMYALHSD